MRRVVAATAARHGVDPQLALAVSWQESGWQMHRRLQRRGDRRDAGAAGHRPPGCRCTPAAGCTRAALADNATAGVLLLGVLRSRPRPGGAPVAAYYQGLGAVREHGLYGETKPYVANVLAPSRPSGLERGRPPA